MSRTVENRFKCSLPIMCRLSKIALHQLGGPMFEIICGFRRNQNWNDYQCFLVKSHQMKCYIYEKWPNQDAIFAFIENKISIDLQFGAGLVGTCNSSSHFFFNHFQFILLKIFFRQKFLKSFCKLLLAF